MRHACLILVGAGVLLGAFDSPALAQADDDEEMMDAPAPSEPSATPAPAPATSATTPVVEERERFPIRRGLYAMGDFGGYFSFGGRSNEIGLPSRTVSNFQPFLGLTIGLDLVSNASINWAAGLRVAAGWNAGSARISASDIASQDQAALQTLPADYTINQVGLGTKLGFMVLDRLAINAIADVGLAVVEPDPTAAATLPGGAPNPDAGGAAFGVNFGVGPGLEFYTLFPGFSVGLDVKFIGTIVSSEFIPGMSVTAPLKYNF